MSMSSVREARFIILLFEVSWRVRRPIITACPLLYSSPRQDKTSSEKINSGLSTNKKNKNRNKNKSKNTPANRVSN